MGTLALRDEYFVGIEGFANYQVSNFGRVVNAKRGNELKTTEDAGGYTSVKLYRDGKQFTLGVHRLVAKAFFADYDGSQLVKHINEDKSENTILNLSLGPRLTVRVGIVETGDVFNSMTECAAFIGCGIREVSEVLANRRRRSVRGYHLVLIDK